MAMSVGPAGGEGEETPMSDINTTPLVDVMLVLLIIFLITVPVVIQTIPMKLPKVDFEPTTTKPENVSLSVAAGRLRPRGLHSRPAPGGGGRPPLRRRRHERF